MGRGARVALMVAGIALLVFGPIFWGAFGNNAAQCVGQVQASHSVLMNCADQTVLSDYGETATFLGIGLVVIAALVPADRHRRSP